MSGQSSHQMLASMCEPFFEEIVTSLGRLTIMSRESLLATCKPFFEQMVVAFQLLVQQRVEEQWSQCGFQPIFYPTTVLTTLMSEASTETNESCAFSSLFSDPSSEGESLEMPERTSDFSETSDSEKSNMVCRHWKSKGWCRYESSCKFLHPEHKRGVSAVKDCGSLDISGMALSDVAAPLMSSQRRRKKGGKSRQPENAALHV